jgi:signal transduction histidine kinase/CheY-like chemotaxis protein
MRTALLELTLKRHLWTLHRRASFRTQLVGLVAAGVLCVALLASLVSAWQASREIRNASVSRGHRVAQNLATQSRLALLSSTPENVSDAINTTLAFPDVTHVEITGTSGRRLVARGEAQPEAPLPAMLAPDAREAYLAGETHESWIFVAPVWIDASSSPFDVVQNPEQRLGDVRVVQSKATLHRIVAQVFFINLGVALFFSALFVALIGMLSARLTRPLSGLAAAMLNAERGDSSVRAPITGPRDIGEMAQAFNRMIGVLQSREEELERHRDHLEELVLERTRELRLAKERAEVANHAKSDFLSRMSHELRTPLNAILGFAQILLVDEHLSERQRRGLSTIHTSGEHLLQLIVDILDLARIEAGKTELHPGAVNLGDLMHGVADIIRIKAQQKGLTFALSLDPGAAQTVGADETRLRQILINLLGNAVKFTDRGQITLALRSGSPDAGRATRLRFEVADTGVGIRGDDAQRIFEPFEQAGAAAQRAGGTGLGLAISQQLVRLMGGELRVDSVSGQGSTFWFELTAPILEPTLAVKAPARRPVAGYEGERRRVLVVDDVADNRAMLNALLGALGFDVETAACGQDALECVPVVQPDLILMDIQMPAMDGLETMRRLRQQGVAQPIIAVSANTAREDSARALAAGANAFLSKPIHRDALLDALGTQLGLNWIYGESAAR